MATTATSAPSGSGDVIDLCDIEEAFESYLASAEVEDLLATRPDSHSTSQCGDAGLVVGVRVEAHVERSRGGDGVEPLKAGHRDDGAASESTLGLRAAADRRDNTDAHDPQAGALVSWYASTARSDSPT